MYIISLHTAISLLSDKELEWDLSVAIKACPLLKLKTFSEQLTALHPWKNYPKPTKKKHLQQQQHKLELYSYFLSLPPYNWNTEMMFTIDLWQTNRSNLSCVWVTPSFGKPIKLIKSLNVLQQIRMKVPKRDRFILLLPILRNAY